MRLVKEDASSEWLHLLLPRRSLYILRFSTCCSWLLHRAVWPRKTGAVVQDEQRSVTYFLAECAAAVSYFAGCLCSVLTLYSAVTCFLPFPPPLYRDQARYNFTHEILKDEESVFDGQRVPRLRRISVMCRNLPG